MSLAPSGEFPIAVIVVEGGRPTSGADDVWSMLPDGAYVLYPDFPSVDGNTPIARRELHAVLRMLVKRATWLDRWRARRRPGYWLNEALRELGRPSYFPMTDFEWKRHIDSWIPPPKRR